MFGLQFSSLAEFIDVAASYLGPVNSCCVRPSVVPFNLLIWLISCGAIYTRVLNITKARYYCTYSVS